MRDNDISDQAILARNLYPGAYDPDTPWSGDVWDRRLAARKAANDALKDRPEWAREVIAKYRGQTPPKRSTEARAAIKQRKEDRNIRIRALRAQGASRAALADEYRLSVNAIDKIIYQST